MIEGVDDARPNLIVLVGLQAAGKTTFFRERFAASHVHVSKDNFPNARNRERRQARLIEEALRAGRDVVVDNTNPSRVVRAPIVALGRALGGRLLAYWFDAELAACRARNGLREGKGRVPEVALRRTVALLEAPTRGEGFERIWRVRLREGANFEVEEYDDGG